MANKPESIVPKKQLRKANKKAKEVVQMMGGKNNKQPVKPKPKKEPKDLTPDIAMSRRILAHATCVANDLAKTDTFSIFPYSEVQLPGVTQEAKNAWNTFAEVEVEFKGIDSDGLIVISPLNEPDEIFCVPLEAVDFESLDNSMRHTVRDTELGSAYNAKVDTRDLSHVQVGCLKIPTTAVREIIANIDELNDLVAERQALLDKHKPVAGVYPHLVWWNKE